MEPPEEKIEAVITYYVLKSGDITFRSLLSFLARHSNERLRRDRVALILSSMATQDKIRVYREKALWRIAPIPAGKPKK